eukprot:6174188-Pleurochrysis_carterae.AAC.3
MADSRLDELGRKDARCRCGCRRRCGLISVISQQLAPSRVFSADCLPLLRIGDSNLHARTSPSVHAPG